MHFEYDINSKQTRNDNNMYTHLIITLYKRKLWLENILLNYQGYVKKQCHKIDIHEKLLKVTIRKMLYCEKHSTKE